jgi:23S rRNA (adenine2503-C2)-methyltransferase
MNSNNKISIKGLSLKELEDFFESIDEKKFRAQQVFNWLHNHLTDDPDEMLNLSKDLRAKLKDFAEIKNLELVQSQQSQTTRTKKYLFRTLDNKNVESVIIPDEKRNTLCISTQVGCPLDCKFCATGLMGYKRNLSSAEIVDQYLLAAKNFGKENITNIVYMGMGEPLLNFDRTVSSLKVFTDELNKVLSKNRITVSTAGIPHKIKELADTGLKVKLALSLHSCFEDIRTRIMPINKKYSLKENLDACKYYSEKTGTRITFEYTMFNGINDRDEDIRALVKLMSSIPSKINIIPFNDIKHMDPDGISAELEPTPMKRIIDFADKLRNKNITVMLRNTQGDDIEAACGQLAIKND